MNVRAAGGLRPDWLGIAAIAGCSLGVNALLLTAPIFMLQVYDRVLPSRSQETLVALFVLVVLLFSAMVLLDHARGRIGARIGAGLQARLDKEVFLATLAPAGPAATTALADLEAIRRVCAAPVAFALFDVPFTPLFLLAIFAFDPLLGLVALLGGVGLVAIAMLNRWLSRRPAAASNQARGEAERMAMAIRADRESLSALGMVEPMLERWRLSRHGGLAHELRLADRNGGLGSLGRGFRMLLQSAILAAGAYLVIADGLSAGVMIAASIMLGRALSPIEQLIAGWEHLVRARLGWRQLGRLLAPDTPRRTGSALGRPPARLAVQALTVLAPNTAKPLLHNLSFALESGQALGVIGESACGKSTLVRSIIGALAPAMGTIRLGGVALEPYGPAERAAHIGYLPQEVRLHDGTIAQNIARFCPDATAEEVHDAASRAGVHDVILQLPRGYDTDVASISLSGGQKQRVGLARALFRQPVLTILDEPNANLDAEGSLALNRTICGIKEAGGIVLVTAHRPTAIAECDRILVLRHGRAVAFGPPEQVLKNTVRNYAQLALV